MEAIFAGHKVAEPPVVLAWRLWQGVQGPSPGFAKIE